MARTFPKCHVSFVAFKSQRPSINRWHIWWPRSVDYDHDVNFLSMNRNADYFLWQIDAKLVVINIPALLYPETLSELDRI